MKNSFLFFFILFLLALSSAEYSSPLNQEWSNHLKTDDIYLVDEDKDGFFEVYAVSYTRNSRSCIYSFTYEGKSLRDECIPEFGRLRYPGANEKTEFTYIADLNSDKALDVLSSVQIIGGSVNVKKLCVAKRDFVYGLNRYEYDLQWE